MGVRVCAFPFYFQHDIIIKRLILKTDMFKLIPLPRNSYLATLKIFAYNDLKATFKVYTNLYWNKMVE